MTEPASAPYRVLARKYRPATFAELIGQDAMVRTLTNAMESGRLAHAFILTGVRGVGKTTTARIIARALNCTGPDGKGGPTITPCGQCDSCRAIAEDRHVDVLEMDAASRTGIGDVREIIESVRYAPVSARFKVYIIDEVHMLSTAAFNGLLKTLEEPPAHVKFIFATTEIRKVPVTVLSRCQRFDLKRVEAEVLIAHLAGIAAKENVAVEPEALALIARAAEGSVRDALSLLDQAIAHGNGSVSAEPVRAMLGLADRMQVFDLYDKVMQGDIAGSLADLRLQYDAGADPLAVLQDMLELTHWLTRIKVTPEAADDVTVAETERRRGAAMAAGLTMAVLARTWQMLLKGIAEVRQATQALAAADMVLIRLAYVAEMPAPGDLVRQLNGKGGEAAASLPGAAPGPAVPQPAPRGGPAPVRPGATAELAVQSRAVPQLAPEVERPSTAHQIVQAVPLPDFAAFVALAGKQRDLILKGQMINFVHLLRFEAGRVEFRPAAGAPADLANRMSERLREWTGERWTISVAKDGGAPTLAQAAAVAEASRRAEVEGHPLVRAVAQAFPGATIQSVRMRNAAAESAAGDDPGANESSDGDE
ncbi:MAG TPA: DNA polymerase III subunit gamma/tau [Candidatus Cybelea sp.]|nr:DNA polymerase III subunit gamma/tau [Candidatus Cybelea sp.]